MLKFRYYIQKGLVQKRKVSKGEMIYIPYLTLVIQEDYPVMLATGAVDKHYKEIYEGDILEYRSLVGQVIYSRGRCGYYIAHYSLRYVLNQGESPLYEIIGNIYENPDLIRRFNNEH